MVIAAAIAAFCCFCCYCCYWCYCCCCCCYCVFFTEMCCNADNLFRLALFYIQTDTCSQLHSHILRQQTNALLTTVSHTFALHFLYTLCVPSALPYYRIVDGSSASVIHVSCVSCPIHIFAPYSMCALLVSFLF